MRILVIALAVLVGGTAVAEVHTPPASCFAQPDRWGYDRDKQQSNTVAGQRFLEDMQKCDPTFAAAVVEATRFQIQKDETDKFFHQIRFLIAAYAICWAVVAAAALTLWVRQRRLVRELAELEARLKAAGAGS